MEIRNLGPVRLLMSSGGSWRSSLVKRWGQGPPNGELDSDKSIRRFKSLLADLYLPLREMHQCSVNE